MNRHRSVLRHILILVLCVLATVGSILQSAARESFSLWDAGYYLALLGALLSIRRLSNLGPQSSAGISPQSGHVLGGLLALSVWLGGCGATAPMEHLTLSAPTALAVGRTAQPRSPAGPPTAAEAGYGAGGHDSPGSSSSTRTKR
jgi:hypothetical protein